MKEIVRETREKIPYRYYSGISMTDAADTPTSFPEHWHMSAEFILALRDGCRFQIGSEDHMLQEGELLLIWPAQLHRTVYAPDAGHMILQFSSELLTSCNDFSLYYFGLQRIHRIGRDMPECQAFLQDKMKECMEFYNQEETFSETKIRIKIYEILLYLCETQLSGLSMQTSESHKNHDTSLRIQNACNYICKNSKENLSQKEVADIAGFSQYYFSRVFREYTQESFTEYLTRQRIQNALALLYQENMSITDVAYLSGFQSLSNFSKVFKNTMHCSPMQYRQKHRQPSREDAREGKHAI